MSFLLSGACGKSGIIPYDYDENGEILSIMDKGRYKEMWHRKNYKLRIW